MRWFSAEREGFEPPVPDGTTVFKTAGLNRSPISPISGAKVELKYTNKNYFLPLQNGFIMK